MTIDELKAAIERRGFLIRLWLPEVDSVKMIVMLDDRSMPWEISTSVLETIKTGIGNLIEHDFRSLLKGQHVVWCLQCHEPLLHTVNQQKALEIYQRRPIPDIVLETKPERVNDVLLQWTERRTIPVDVIVKTGDAGLEAIKQATEYRSAKVGPDSPVLTNCPKCGALLDVGTVAHIDDAQTR